MSWQQLDQIDMTFLQALLKQKSVGIDRAAHHCALNSFSAEKAFRKLADYGCEIDKIGTDTYRLIRTGLGVWEDYLTYTLRDSGLWFDEIKVYKETGSTQDVVKQLIPKQSVILAGHQSSGRGRLGRTWESQPGSSVLLSVGKRINGGHGNHDRLSMLVGVAISRTIKKVSPDVSIQLKWPNDVMVSGRKLAGILIEVSSGMHLIGIGLNVNRTDKLAPEISDQIIAVNDLGEPIDRLYVIDVLLHQLGGILRSQDIKGLLDEWRELAQLGQTQTFEHHNQHITGEVLDLDPDHGLIVRRNTGEIVTLPAATTSVVK